jgi:hypothetical protein
METIKNKTGRKVKKGDTVVVTRAGGNGTTKDKEYEVTHVQQGMAGQAVTFYDDNGEQRTVNGYWWDFPKKLATNKNQ